jgi:hypothetical protein
MKHKLKDGSTIRVCTATAPITLPEKVLNAWQPNSEEEKYVLSIARMGLDAIAGNGVLNRETFVENLKGFARILENLKENHENQKL